jgi:hypothetical protein
MIADGVDLKKIDQKLVLRSAKQFKVPTGGTIATVVKALKAKLNDSDGDVGDCTVCGGPWPTELGSCPFCGDEDREEKTSSDDRAEAAADDSSAPSSVMGGTESEEPPDPSSRAMAHVERAPLEAMGGNGRLATAQTEEQLDKAVAVINEGKSHAARGMYAIAMTFRRIVDSNLWKMRTDDKGTPLYQSWSDFANKELEFSRTYAERMLKTAREFDRPTIEEFGINRLVIVVQAPLEHRAKVLDAARAGASRAKLQQITKELNDAKGRTGKGGAGNSKKAPEVKPTKDSLAIATMLEKKATVPLYAPKKDKHGDFVPAKKLDDLPHGWLDMTNGVRLVFQVLRMPSGQMKLTVTAKREA